MFTGALGCKHAGENAFPRNSIFHLALTQWLYTTCSFLCETGALDSVLPVLVFHPNSTDPSAPSPVKGAFFLQDFFRIQCMCWGVLRVYITLYLVPTKGVEDAKKQWNMLLAIAWIIPLCR